MVFEVDHPTFGSIGVFESERVELLDHVTQPMRLLDRSEAAAEGAGG